MVSSGADIGTTFEDMRDMRKKLDPKRKGQLRISKLPSSKPGSKSSSSSPNATRNITAEFQVGASSSDSSIEGPAPRRDK